MTSKNAGIVLVSLQSAHGVVSTFETTSKRWVVEKEKQSSILTLNGMKLSSVKKISRFDDKHTRNPTVLPRNFFVSVVYTDDEKIFPMTSIPRRSLRFLFCVEYQENGTESYCYQIPLRDVTSQIHAYFKECINSFSISAIKIYSVTVQSSSNSQVLAVKSSLEDQSLSYF